MAEDYEKERTLEQTATWAVAIVCSAMLAISILFEHGIHLFEKFLKKKSKVVLVEAFEKFKSELMLLGFISLLLTVLQVPISNICVPRNIANSWLPCKLDDKYGRRLREFSEFDGVNRRSLASKGYDNCTGKGQYAFVTAYGIHQLHIFIFVFAIFHVLYCLATLAVANSKMRRWEAWEKETKTIEYKFFNDPERSRLTRETSFGRRHLSFWSRWSISVWIVSFSRQFFGSIKKVDYLTLRNGFIKARLPEGREMTFDFQDYIQRSLEEDFKEVVGISPVIYFSAVLFLLTYTHEWRSFIWFPFITLFIVLLVGTKLEVIITKMGLRIQERENVVKGIPIVRPGDDLFWFGRPRLLLLLIHIILFQNALQLAFFAWGTYSFGLKNCFHKHTAHIVFRVSMGVFIQVLCSYETLPLYALVIQMGSTMKPTTRAHLLQNYNHRSEEIIRHSDVVEEERPESANQPSAPPQPIAPNHSDSSSSSWPTKPAHLLQNYNHRSEEITRHSDVVEEERPESADQPSAPPQPTAPNHSDPSSSSWPTKPAHLLQNHSHRSEEITRHSDVVEEERPESTNQPSAPLKPAAPNHSDPSSSSWPTKPAHLLQNYSHRSEEITRHSDVVEEERPESANQPSAPPQPTAPNHSDISLVGK